MAPGFGSLPELWLRVTNGENPLRASSKDLLNPIALIQKYYDPQSELYRILIIHSVLVTAKALQLARDYLKNHPKAKVDLALIEEAAMLHDVGIFRCHAPEIMCIGAEPYICHGIVGREIVEKEGLPRHAVVCERHTGVGITRDEVIPYGLLMASNQ